MEDATPITLQLTPSWEVIRCGFNRELTGCLKSRRLIEYDGEGTDQKD